VSDGDIGVQALLRSGKLRDDIFITTKIHPQDLGYHPTMAAFKTSLKAFSTDYVDLVLLHYAACFGSLCSTEPQGTWRESWRALEDLVREGQVLAIGVFCASTASKNVCTMACMLRRVSTVRWQHF
jgi:diketogulonate reductase-like aldo/keto reductase